MEAIEVLVSVLVPLPSSKCSSKPKGIEFELLSKRICEIANPETSVMEWIFDHHKLASMFISALCGF